MTSLLQEVTRSGTAAKARVALKRDDIYGKTGTTNDSMDAGSGDWYLTDDVDPVVVDGENYHPDHVPEQETEEEGE
jgi:hypothetical protein